MDWKVEAIEGNPQHLDITLHGHRAAIIEGGIALLIGTTFQSLAARDAKAAGHYIAGVVAGIQQAALTGQPEVHNTTGRH